MKPLYALMFTLLGISTGISENPVETTLIPYCDPLDSGMTSARKKFVLFHKPGCEGYWRFVSLCEAAMKKNPDFHRQQGWVYLLASQATEELKSEGIPIIKPGAPSDTPLGAAVKKYPGLFDFTTDAYHAFIRFSTGPLTEYKSVDAAMNAYVAYLAVEKERNARGNPSNRGGSSDMIAAQREREEDARSRQASANTATRKNAEEAKKRAAEERKAAAGRSNINQTTVIYHGY